MSALERQTELIEKTQYTIARTEHLMVEHPEETGLAIELKSFRKQLAKLLAKSVPVIGNLVGVDTVRRRFRLEVDEGPTVEGRLAETVEQEYPLHVPRRYQAELKTVRRVASSGKDLTRYILSDLTPVD